MHRAAPVTGPAASVVVATRDRPVRLRWLLNALADQATGERIEVIVAHDSRGPETERLLRTHPLRDEGRLSHLTFPAHTQQAAARIPLDPGRSILRNLRRTSGYGQAPQSARQPVAVVEL